MFMAMPISCEYVCSPRNIIQQTLNLFTSGNRGNLNQSKVKMG